MAKLAKSAGVQILIFPTVPTQAPSSQCTSDLTDCWCCCREKKIEGLTSIRSLSQHHAELLLPRLHDLCLAVTEEVRRSLLENMLDPHAAYYSVSDRRNCVHLMMLYRV